MPVKFAVLAAGIFWPGLPEQQRMPSLCLSGLSKEWRTEKYLQKLEALLIVADKETTLVITGSGDVLEPEHSVVAVGSGGNYALSAARALVGYETDAETLGRKAMQIAADICVYTNGHFTVETLDV
jgi:ATP-dependent HslUV protease subunit HslV